MLLSGDKHDSYQKEPYKQSSYKNTQVCKLKTSTAEFQTLLTTFKVTNYSLFICIQSNFIVKECHINCKPHKKKTNMQLNSESHIIQVRLYNYYSI